MNRERSRSKERVSKYDEYRKRKSEETFNMSTHSDHSRPMEFQERRKKSPFSPRRRNPERGSNSSIPADDDQDSRTIFVWQLSKKIREADLREFFSRAGPLKDIRLIKDQRTDRPKGIAYVEFFRTDSVNKAMAYAGSRLLGVPIQINQVLDKPDSSDGSAAAVLDNEYADRGGVGLGNTGRLALMAKLAEGTGLQLPKPALDMMKNSLGSSATGAQNGIAVGDVVNMKNRQAGPGSGSGGSDCFVISNMFDNHSQKQDAEYFKELREDVADECGRIGKGVSQVMVDDKSSGGHVYVRCYSMDDASKCINVMNNRYFSGRLLSASFISPSAFHQLSINRK